MGREPDSIDHQDDLDFNITEEEFKLVDEHLDQEEDPNYILGFQVGFDTGYIEGYQEGQLLLAMEKESAIYNRALKDIITQISKFNFEEKENVIVVLNLLQQV